MTEKPDVYIPVEVIRFILDRRRERLAAEAKAKREAIIRVVDILAELGALVQAEKESSDDTG